MESGIRKWEANMELIEKQKDLKKLPQFEETIDRREEGDCGKIRAPMKGWTPWERRGTNGNR